MTGKKSGNEAAYTSATRIEERTGDRQPGLQPAAYIAEPGFTTVPSVNRIEIAVTKKWTNRLIGDRTLPEDQRALSPSGVLPGRPARGGAFGRPQIPPESELLGDVRVIAIHTE